MTLWAKTRGRGTFLPLERHLADAGAVAARLWDLTLTPRQRAWFARGYAADEAEARAWVCFLAAVHDVGKASPDFQSQVEDLAGDPLDGEMARSEHRRERRPHDAIGGALLLEWLEARGASRRDAEQMAATISGHHSAPRPRQVVRMAGSGRGPAWRQRQLQLIEGLATRFGVDDLSIPSRVSPATVLGTAGLICVSDWVASDAGRFPVTDGERPSSEELAAAAVRRASWAPHSSDRTRSFPDLFAGETPRATQRAVLDLLDSGVADEPFLLVIEDRTGSGKTEAAYCAIQRGLAAGHRGFYVGMPTQATANQLHRRTVGFLDRLWPGLEVAPRLLHGGVHHDLDEPAPVGVGDGGGSPEEDAIAQTWFSQTRRGLLSPYAVGTVDQALMAVLQARFYPVRMFGLQGKVVVFDEVHAYDAYTGLLLERLVGWLAALDCTVVLLSATLPAAVRGRLLGSYLKGLGGGGRVDSRALTEASYPRLTLGSRAKVETIEVGDDRPGREVTLSWAPIADDVEAIAAQALEEVAGGGCIAVVCSTVRQAQDLFVALRAAAALGDVELILFHARLRPLEREPVERRLLEALGPPTDADHRGRPRKLIAVATQVIEQSLDLDFDAMLTQLAPVDLLIQRSGRVHRHAHATRPVKHATARLTILDTPGESPVRAFSAGSRAVYGGYLLARTRLALSGTATLREPADLDSLIEAVYATDVEVGNDEDERKAVADLAYEADREKNKRTEWAEELALRLPGSGRPPWEHRTDSLSDQEDPDATVRRSAVTRYTEDPSVSVVLLFPDELAEERRSPSGKDVRELLLRSVSVSSRLVTTPLLGAGRARSRDSAGAPFRPARWLRSGRLRYHFLIELDADGVPLPIGYGESVLPMRLDTALGLVIGTGEADEVRPDQGGVDPG